MIPIDLPERFRSVARIVSSESVSDPGAWLTPAERIEAARIRSERRRDEWILGRIAAKRLAIDLGLCESPRDCAIPSRGVKPRLLLGGEPSPLELSISHSGPLAAAALDQRPVGIDIQMKRRIDPRSTRFFLRDDEAVLATDPDEGVLLDLWSAKEAALKASGARLYREISLERSGDERTFHFASGSMSGYVETVWLGEGEAILAIAKGAA